LSDDELAIQGLAIRMFNDLQSSVKLALSGYYQSSVVFIRTIVETGYLIDYFTIKPEKIELWRTVTETERLKLFKPVDIRTALDNRDGYTSKRRYEIYSRLSEYGGHPTFKSFQLFSPKGLGYIGPFNSQTYLKAYLEEVVMYLPYFVFTFFELFNNEDTIIKENKELYLLRYRDWKNKYKA
ncbi:hypothetical protein AB4Z21_34435, partial [Paenibacillus sp. MCAF20]